jgi:CxxC motif-containing protein (DUF1111 family)
MRSTSPLANTKAVRRLQRLLLSCALSISAACAGNGGTPQGAGHLGDANGDGDSSQGPGDDNGDGDHTNPGQGNGDGDGTHVGLPSGSCEGTAPAPFATLCGGCHGAGEGGNGVPALFGFSEGKDAFVKKVRSGGGGMPAFSADALSDDAVASFYAFFGEGKTTGGATELGSVVPLFDGQDFTALPITFLRDDGVLITRGAGRVRQRHELEGTYGPFGPHYFEFRTYGFIIEDYTARGESRLKVTYLPIAMPQDKTNFRCFKVYDNGNVFHSNSGMDSDVAFPSMMFKGKDLAADYQTKIAPYARTQSHEMTNNPRENRDIQKGDLFEFEFGIFIEPGAIRADTRFSYYTDTFRYQVGVGGLTPDNADTSGTVGPEISADMGGSTTTPWLYAEPETYFGQFALNIQHENVQHFVEGRRLFHTDFETGKHTEDGNPDFPEMAGKAGPLKVTNTCDTCHKQNGGGVSLAMSMDDTSSMAFKLRDAGELGNQLQLGEGTATRTGTQAKDVTLGDGTTVHLEKPVFTLTAAAGDASHFSARIARRLLGLGLLESIPETTLLDRADPKDCNGDGISGRPSFIKDPVTGDMRIGRFGWKAEKVSVAHQVADAASADLGVSTPIFPEQDGTSDLDADALLRLTTYMRLLTVPGQRDRDNADVQHGEALFKSVGCANCHAPDATTGSTHPFVELHAQHIRPFTDLLLHDLGPDLADETKAPASDDSSTPAAASEWRTAPLWGVGLSQTVQGYVSLLHDGRAHSVLEAVLWHGGEAEAIREKFKALPTADREALVKFVESL